MITAEFARVMARYNRWQNDSLYGAADTLDDAAREADRGAYFGSIRATLSHLLWGDTVWMGRFDGGPMPDVGIRDSAGMVTGWADLKARRGAMDDRISAWAAALPELKEGDELSFYSGSLGGDVTKPLGLCIAHFFNHQTHHRGQVHAMLTAAGARPDATDLFIMPGAG